MIHGAARRLRRMGHDGPAAERPLRAKAVCRPARLELTNVVEYRRECPMGPGWRGTRGFARSCWRFLASRSHEKERSHEAALYGYSDVPTREDPLGAGRMGNRTRSPVR